MRGGLLTHARNLVRTLADSAGCTGAGPDGKWSSDDDVWDAPTSACHRYNASPVETATFAAATFSNTRRSASPSAAR